MYLYLVYSGFAQARISCKHTKGRSASHEWVIVIFVVLSSHHRNFLCMCHMTTLQSHMIIHTSFQCTYMEAQVITSFLPDLVTAISDIVQPVSDQCLAKGLIPESVYKRVLESGGTSEDKARTLILAVKTSTETDSRCLGILLTIL